MLKESGDRPPLLQLPREAKGMSLRQCARVAGLGRFVAGRAGCGAAVPEVAGKALDLQGLVAHLDPFIRLARTGD
jgi:hypothetical protein